MLPQRSVVELLTYNAAIPKREIETLVANNIRSWLRLDPISREMERLRLQFEANENRKGRIAFAIAEAVLDGRYASIPAFNRAWAIQARWCNYLRRACHITLAWDQWTIQIPRSRSSRRGPRVAGPSRLEDRDIPLRPQTSVPYHPRPPAPPPSPAWVASPGPVADQELYYRHLPPDEDFDLGATQYEPGAFRGPHTISFSQDQDVPPPPPPAAIAVSNRHAIVNEGTRSWLASVRRQRMLSDFRTRRMELFDRMMKRRERLRQRQIQREQVMLLSHSLSRKRRRGPVQRDDDKRRLRDYSEVPNVIDVPAAAAGDAEVVEVKPEPPPDPEPTIKGMSKAKLAALRAYIRTYRDKDIGTKNRRPDDDDSGPPVPYSYMPPLE